MDKALKYALMRGATYVEVRGQEYLYEYIRAHNGELKEFSRTTLAGIGIRLAYKGKLGFSATNTLKEDAVLKAVDYALSAAEVSDDIVKLEEGVIARGVVRSSFKVDPADVPEEEKVRTVIQANKAGLEAPSIKSSDTALGIQKDRRYVMTSDGADAEWLTIMTGVLQSSVASENGSMERVHDSKSKVAGWEFIHLGDWQSFSKEVSLLAGEALKAGQPRAGKAKVVADPELIGLILHEAFGHASEGDLVGTGNSVLQDKVGEEVASPQVSIVDDGMVEGGYFMPFDDEGSEKRRTVIVQKGVLKQFLTDKTWGRKLGMPVTGNGRAQDYSNPPIVRQTNLFMEGGDWSLEELIQEAREGLYLSGRGARGGEVNTSAGTFTFSVGPSRIIRNGELGEVVRGTVVSGSILEALKGVVGVGKDVSVRTSVFGGCGKEGQMVRVGHGGPHVLIKELTVGGR